MKNRITTIVMIMTIATIIIGTTTANASIGLPGLDASQYVNVNEWGQSANTYATFEANSGAMPGEWWIEDIDVDIRIGEIVDYIKIGDGDKVTWEEVSTGEYWFNMNLNANGTFADEMGISSEVISSSRGISLGDLSAYISFNIDEESSEWRGDYLDLDGYGNLSHHFDIERESLNFNIYDSYNGELTWYLSSDFSGTVDLSTWQADIIKGSNLYGGTQIMAIPEPATMSLLALGGLAVLARRRKK